MKIILVEHDNILRAEMYRVLNSFPMFEVTAILDTVEDALQYVQENEVDAAFTNIQPNSPHVTSDGNRLAQFLKEYNPDVQTIIYSSDRKCDVCQSLSFGCSGFLWLPLDLHAVQQVVNRLTYVYDLQQFKKESVGQSILVKTRTGYQLVRLDEILFVERRNRKNCIITDTGKEIALYRYTMDELGQQLGGGFYRCYTSFIVNLSKVASIQVDNEKKVYTLLFEGYNGHIHLSRDKYPEVLALLKEKYAKINL